MDKEFETVILSACRTPIGAFGGVFKDVSAVDLGAIVIREAIARAGVKPADVGDVVMGCVLQAGAGMNVARQAALKAGLPVEVPAETVNRVCGSGMQAVVHAVEAIRVGYVDTMVAGGTESMSNAPYLLPGARWGYRMGNAEVVDSMLREGLTCAIGLTHMGITAEEVASRYNVSRADQDAFAAESQQRAVRAINEGRFKDEIVPVSIPQTKGDPVRGRHRRISAAGNDRREAGGAEAGVQEGRVGDRRQRVRHQRRRGRAGRHDRREGEGDRDEAARADPVVRLDRRRSDDHGDRAGAGGPEGARARRADDRRHRSLRAERSVRGAVGRRERASSVSIPRR